jgi:hypothetical protein
MGVQFHLLHTLVFPPKSSEAGPILISEFNAINIFRLPFVNAQ